MVSNSPSRASPGCASRPPGRRPRAQTYTPRIPALATLPAGEDVLSRCEALADEAKVALREQLKTTQRDAEAAADRAGEPLSAEAKERWRSRRESSVTRRRTEVYVRELEHAAAQLPDLLRELHELRAHAADPAPDAEEGAAAAAEEEGASVERAEPAQPAEHAEHAEPTVGDVLEVPAGEGLGPPPRAGKVEDVADGLGKLGLWQGDDGFLFGGGGGHPDIDELLAAYDASGGLDAYAAAAFADVGALGGFDDVGAGGGADDCLACVEDAHGGPVPPVCAPVSDGGGAVPAPDGGAGGAPTRGAVIGAAGDE